MEYDGTHGNNEGVEMAGALEDQSDASMILPRNLLSIRPMTNPALTSPASPEEDTPAYDSIRFIEVRHSVVYVHTALWVLHWAIPDVYGFSAWELARMAGCLCSVHSCRVARGRAAECWGYRYGGRRVSGVVTAAQ
jgi:hypothetical protein